MSNTINIGLMWHSLKSDNLGVGALTLSQVEIINEAARALGLSVAYKVWGTQGGKDYSAYLGDRLISSGDISLREIVMGRSTLGAEMSSCHLIFDIGEGDSFSDIYGLKRFFLHVITKWMALGKCPLILSPQTIGPYARASTRFLASRLMKRCRKVFARDDISKDYLAKLGVVSNTGVAIDVAFALPYQRKAFPGDKIKVGVNVSGLLFNGGYSKNNMFGLQFDYRQFAEHLLEKLTADDRYQVYLVPHVVCESYPVDDDFKACQCLHEQFPNTVLAPTFKDPIEAKSYIAGMDFFTGSRMHACIAAFSSGVPVVPVSYSRKFNGLFKSMGYEYLADPTTQNEEQVLGSILEGLSRRAELAEKVYAGNRIAASRLNMYREFVAEALDKVLRTSAMP
ncbi:MAG: polysaccharide pyruvyl transferase family protein [Dechloromonas sp.]|uniref:polysaccharide pyruvyl transferase family protein n=1 Tax=Dechloromonas sp. TaxID=1917218 RepID=UPI0027E8393F|nr:polysaccharide pyruvyl transferase family protein [Dechloromonas sp.]MBT9521958.1 polysaccharide pyruvyl transferase family protein [Dechloromonas sp.]